MGNIASLEHCSDRLLGSSEKVVPDWVWERKWSRNWARKATIFFGLFIMALGVIVLIGSFEVQQSLVNTCANYPPCVGPSAPISPVNGAWIWAGYALTPAGTALTIGGFFLAFITWRVKEWEWAAMFGLHPLARRLEYLYSQGKVTKQDVEEILNIVTHHPSSPKMS